MTDWWRIHTNFRKVGICIWQKKGYYEAVIPQMNYIAIFDVRKDIVNIVGIFHQLENYLSKL